eukprot:CAMPEP_0197030010 /NCGR_PEP_ID=MMETSP1384-20130603/9335_1 /TAXON_ID=29189 /ORGANISM="Ammonia sp." /LENGTH=261 /DNA_ID=CAMNT_0042459283 /DNA_START=29 /DNA_END=811 /DNA_ORIENTATION=+
MSSFLVFLAIFRVIYGDTTEAPTTTEDVTTTSGCAEDGDWTVDYIGKSTQFRIYNPCNAHQFLKVKMEKLIEYDADSKQTKNKLSSFASTSWTWLNPNGQNTQYNNYSVVKNVFAARDIIDDGVDFNLTTIFFKENAEINDGDQVEKNSLKFNIDIAKWPFKSTGNTLRLCINLMTNGANSSHANDNETAGVWNAGDFQIYTLSEAECGGQNETLAVSVTDGSNSGDDSESSSHRNICFDFDYCESGDIRYDPIITFAGSS